MIIYDKSRLYEIIGLKLNEREMQQETTFSQSEDALLSQFSSSFSNKDRNATWRPKLVFSFCTSHSIFFFCVALTLSICNLLHGSLLLYCLSTAFLSRKHKSTLQIFSIIHFYTAAQHTLLFLFIIPSFLLIRHQ